MKRFQKDQNLDADGKLSSLSLIALGTRPEAGADCEYAAIPLSHRCRSSAGEITTQPIPPPAPPDSPRRVQTEVSVSRSR